LVYALGWIIQLAPNGNIVWHNGSTRGFGSFFGMVPDKNVGVIVLTNEENVDFPDALGLWTLDCILDNPKTDHLADALKTAKTHFETRAKLFAKPREPTVVPCRWHRSPAISPTRASVKRWCRWKVIRW
jgi:hypothetical protein